MIKELTSEQISIFPSIIDKFIKLGLSTQPLNQPKVIEAVNLAYQCTKLDKPKEIIFVKSPMVGINLIKKLTKSQDWFYPINYGYDIANVARCYIFQQLGLTEETKPKLGLTEETKPMVGLFALAEECGPIWTFENLCIVSERPTSLILNEQDQLHNLKGPTISWSDGYCQYWVNGKFIHPTIGERLAWYLNSRKSSNQPKFSLEKELNKYKDLNLEVGNQVHNRINNQIENQVWNPVLNQIWNQVYDQIYHQVNKQVWNQVINQISNQVWYQIWYQICAQVLKQN